MRFCLQGRVVVLTGAASGIGAALAERVAQRGAVLALVDRDSVGLAAIAERLKQAGNRAAAYAMDVTDREAVAALPGRVRRDLGAASVLINNAGIALSGQFEQVAEGDFDHLMEINFASTVRMTRAFLPHLRESAPSQIVSLSSILGILGAPGQVAYCASKFALRGFSEALRAELAGSNVGVSVVHPGGIRTNIAVDAMQRAGWTGERLEAGRIAANKALRMDPRDAAARIVRGLERREKRMLVGADAVLLTWLQRLLPVAYGRLLPRPGEELDKN
jgi:short-subunit dehydrogenase